MKRIRNYGVWIVNHAKILSIVLFCSLLFSGFLWGENAISYIQGPVVVDDVARMMKDSEQSGLDHAYVTTELDMITGSYAQVGADEETIYYLMPIDDASAFITVIASGEHKDILNEMERAFYSSIGNEDHIYPESVQVDAGFKKLRDEELSFALTYFNEYDEAIQTQEDVLQIMSPYALVIDEIGTMPVQEISVLLVIWMGVFCFFLCCIALVIYQLIQRKKGLEKNKGKDFV